MSVKHWSEQQVAIFLAIVEGIRNIVVRARAGTGKTTTIVEAVKRYVASVLHAGERVVVCAFNKKIAAELVTRFAGMPVEVKTLHALGNSIVLKFWPRIPVNDKKKNPITRADDLTERATAGRKVEFTVARMISKLHTLGRETMPLATSGRDLDDLAVNFECEPDDAARRAGWTTEMIADYAYRAMELATTEKFARLTGIDFADMIYLPVRLKLTSPTFDLVVVDEAQDMTLAQLMIATGVCRGRVVVVGDDRQAIYGFRGADSESLDRLKNELDAEEFGLTVTYRCGKNIVEAAREFVPDFEAAAGNVDGLISSITRDKLVDSVAYGDFILSRKNAPLVGTAMSLLRNGKRAKIAGKSIGDDLIKIAERLGKASRSVPEFIERLEGWKEREVARAKKLKNPEPKIELTLDMAETLLAVSDGVRNVEEILDRIAALFTDDGLGAAGVVTLSSVHKAKGLEADRVFILADTLRSDSQEELNIHYVAITRAKSLLVYVHEVAA